MPNEFDTRHLEEQPWRTRVRERIGNDEAILILDVQRDFCPGGALPTAGGDAVVDPLNQLIARARGSRIPIHASRDWHPRGHVSFLDQGGTWPVHCVQDTPGAAFHPKLQLPVNTVIISKGVRLDKDQLSAFDETGLAKHLKDLEVHRLWVGGLATEICVKASIQDARKAGFEVVVLQSTIAAIDSACEDRALREIRAAGAHILAG